MRSPEPFTLAWWHAIGRMLLDKSFSIFLIVAVVYLARLIIGRMINVSLLPPWSRDRLAPHQINRLKTLQGILKSLVNFVLLFIGVIQLLKAIGGEKYDITPILTTAGVTGIAIGFGAQKLVRDTISGFFILLEDQYAVGDYVTINDATGIIESVGMRITRIRDDQGRLITLSNGDVTKVTNYSRGAVESILEISVAANADFDQVLNTLNEACGQFEAEGLQEKPSVQGVSSFDAAKMTFKLLIKADPKLQTVIQTRLREALRTALLKANIPLA